jgi:outer membrane protein assembly factor BamB
VVLFRISTNRSHNKIVKTILSTVLTVALAAPLATAQDWPMWGGDASRNMVGKATGLPTDINAGEIDAETEKVDLTDAKNVRWVAKLGSQAYGNTVVAGGKVYIGTNNEVPRDPKQEGDRGNLMCFDEKSGEFLWQLIIPKLGAGKVSDWEYVGLCSSPAVEGDRIWLVTNRGEVVCLDANGMANGNDGDYQDEAKYMQVGDKAVEVTNQHADILWIYDMREELGIFPHNVSSCSPLVVGDLVYTSTSNGVDWSHTNIPAPRSPSLVALDKKTGKLKGEEISGVSERVLHASWSSPAYGKVGDKNLIVWGGGDGWAYGFDPIPVMDEDEGVAVLKEAWRYDCNPPTYRAKEDGTPIKYATYKGPSEVIGTTILHEGRVYAIIGQDPEHGDGVGRLNCIDAATGKAVWTFDDTGRSISTVSVSDGLVYAAEYDGDLHCLDAATGKELWKHETQSRIWGSSLVADGKVYLPTEDGDVYILAAGKEKKLLAQIQFGAPIYSSPIVANNVVYIATQTHLYALGKK